MQNCWKRFTSDRPHFDAIQNILSTYMDRLKRPDSVYYSDSETDEETENVQRQGSGKLPARTPSLREGKDVGMSVCIIWSYYLELFPLYLYVSSFWNRST